VKKNIAELLRANPYPGRGILIGCSEDGKRSVVVYFIMGRSENSRNRIFVKTDDGIKTSAFDPSKLTDPSLVIYHPVRVVKECFDSTTIEFTTIVTNGDQTDTIAYNLINYGIDPCIVLMDREFEPDPPHYTPRISAVVERSGRYTLSILKTMSGDPNECQRNFFKYSGAIGGLGHFISTYETDGDPLPSFTGEPIPVCITDSCGFEAFVYEIWNALNELNKVSLYARETDLETLEVNDLIINKHN